MCRNIRPLYNFDPPATEAEIRDASMQFVRKISGFSKPSKINEKPFLEAVDQISHASGLLLHSLKTGSPKRNREEEVSRAKALAIIRFSKRETG
jgi:hypothetical protein